MDNRFSLDICCEERQVICRWFRRRRFTPILTIQLQDERCVRASATTLVFEECPARLWQDALPRLTDAMLVKLKLKRGNKTIGKQMMGARPILDALLLAQSHKVPLSLAVQTYHPFELLIKVNFYLVGADSLDHDNEDRRELYSEQCKRHHRFRKSWITRLLQQRKVSFVTSVTTLWGLVGNVRARKY